MNKNRLLMFCCVLSMIIALHGYFYLHHLTKLKVSSYSGWDVFSKKSQVQIKEIRLVNKSKKQNYEPIQRYILFPMYEHKFIPVSIKTFVSKLILFYTLPYEDKWHLEVSGIYLAPKNTEFSDGPELRLSADGIGLPFNGRTTMGWDEGNIRFFLITVENVNPKIDTMDITWKWNGQNGQQVLKTNFKEQYYNYFEKKPEKLDNFNPEKIAMDYFWSFYQGYNSTSTASVKVHGARLQWVKNYKHVSSTVNSVYLKKYKNGEGVFEVTMGFYFSNDNLEHVREPGGTQTFYVSETDGKWEILSIGPFINKDK